MRFAVYTLVDITNSKITDPNKRLPYSQAQNLNTLLQTIDLRAQPLNWKVTHRDTDVREYNFDCSGVHTIWRLEVEIEHDIDVEVFMQDLLGVPYIGKLFETYDSSVPVFDKCNTYLERI